MNLPRHVAIIMDGNGRWARSRNMMRIAGHRAGAKTVRKIVEHSAKRGIEVLTLFAFGLDNQARPPSEVKFLMGLLLDSLERETVQLHENNVRLRIIGDRSSLDPKLIAQIESSERLTQHNKGLTLVIAINYSGKWDITNAVHIIAEKIEAGIMSSRSIDSALIQKYVCLSDLPEPDLFIRTSGEQRLSNFMLWQFAYTELYFTPLFWPDFDSLAFDEALQFYSKRQRRFGRTSEQIEKQHA